MAYARFAYFLCVELQRVSTNQTHVRQLYVGVGCIESLVLWTRQVSSTMSYTRYDSWFCLLVYFSSVRKGGQHTCGLGNEGQNVEVGCGKERW